jgi:hypothetical protein
MARSYFSSAVDATVRRQARGKRLRIKNGRDGMPSYDRILSSKELDGAVAYLKTL